MFNGPMRCKHYLTGFKTQMNTILGLKKETTQTFLEGFRLPVTKITAGPCVVTQIKTQGKDGYWAIQLGFGKHKSEVRVEKEPEAKVGDEIKISDIFDLGDIVAVSGTSKGKGFAGGVKRHHFHGGPRTHGQSDRERAPGSIGQGTTPGRVHKGKRMAGRMGGGSITVKNLHVISIDSEKNELVVSGPVPGIPGSFLRIKKIKKGSLKDLEKEVVAQVVEGEVEEPKNVEESK